MSRLHTEHPFGVTLSALAAFVLCLSSRARADDPAYLKDLGAPGEYAVEEAPALGPAEARFDVYCPVSSGMRPVIVLLTELGHAAGSARALGRHLASHGIPVMIPDLSQASASGAATRVEAAKAAFEAVVLEFRPGMPCASLRSCVESGGSDEKCYKWSAPALGASVAVGSGAQAYLELLRRDGCSRRGSDVLVDPDFGPSPPDLGSCESSELTLLLADSGSCRSDVGDVLDDQLDTVGTESITLSHASHCDAVDDASPECAARCGGSSAQAKLLFRRYLVGYLLGYAREAKGWENRWIYAYPEHVKYEWRSPSKASAVIGFNGSVVLGVGGRGSDHDELRVKGVAALRPELIFGRTSARSFGVGPYVEAGWLATSSFSLGGGASLLVPLGRSAALVPSFGAFTHRRDDAWRAGGAFGFFVGRREFNDISAFDASNGLRVEARADLDAHGERALYLAYQTDLTSFFALAALGSGFRGD